MKKWIIEDNAAGKIEEIEAKDLLEACRSTLDRLNIAVWDKKEYAKNRVFDVTVRVEAHTHEEALSKVLKQIESGEELVNTVTTLAGGYSVFDTPIPPLTDNRWLITVGWIDKEKDHAYAVVWLNMGRDRDVIHAKAHASRLSNGRVFQYEVGTPNPLERTRNTMRNLFELDEAMELK